MKKIILSTVAVMSIAAAVSAADVSADSVENALKDGKFTMDARVFYFDRSFDTSGKDNVTSLTAGGIMKYTTKKYMGLTAGLAYYSSNSIAGLYSKQDGAGSNNLTSDGDNINILGEAYLQYDRGNSMLKVGRQKLDTPLMNNHDLRTIATSYEAAIVKNKDIPGTEVELGYVWAFTDLGSNLNDFSDNESAWGDKGLAYVLVKNNSIKELKIKAQYVKTVSDEYELVGADTDIDITDYKYADVSYAIPFGKSTYVKAQYGGNAYNTGDDSTMVGAKTGTTLGMFDVAVLYNQIQDNEFKAVEAGPMYSDWQQGYGNYEPSTAFGGQVTVKPMDDLSVKAGYVDVSADEDSVKDDYTEINIDANYKINNISKVRVRYSMKDQSSKSEDAGAEDRNDFRVIYYVSF
ncbi:MAG: imipenem/basic amino acid-specific outer membrane pore [Sulfurimonas sp.]|jgi:imipenem/basic amino acid-specific outer membrane pore